MTNRSAARVAWLLYAVTVCELIVFAALLWQRWSLLQANRAIGMQGALLGLFYPVMGALIASKRPRNPIGWIFIVIGMSAAASAVATVLSTDVPRIDVPGAPAGAIWGDWLNQWVWVPSWLAIPTFVLLLFPDGRLPHRRFRGVAVLAAVAMAVAAVGGILSPNGGDTARPGYHNPVVIVPSSINSILPIAIMALLFSGVGSLVALIYRFRRSRGDEREQLKWFAFAGIATAALYFGLSVQATTGPVQALGFIAIPLLPTAAAVAILRYHLYDIDRIISRTVSYAIVTAVLGGIFALVVLVPTAVLGSGGRVPDWMVAVATLLVAALFRPVRRRVQDTVDHRFNRKKYDAANTIDAFSARLREQTEIEVLQTDLESIVRQTMQPAYVSLWLARQSPR